jgi:uncharacterized phiE125 gp8 family phage protein
MADFGRIWPRRVPGPYTDPLTVAEAKLHLRVDADQTVEDTYISNLITLAREYCEDRTGVAVMSASWSLVLPAFPIGRSIELLAFPVTAVSSVAYYDSENTLQTLDSQKYQVDTRSLIPTISLAYGEYWPSTYDRSDAVAVTFLAGYASASSVPAKLKHAMLLLIAHWYEHREEVALGVTPMSMKRAVDDLLALHTVPI